MTSKRPHKRTAKKPVYKVQKAFGRADDRFQRLEDFEDDGFVERVGVDADEGDEGADA